MRIGTSVAADPFACGMPKIKIDDRAALERAYPPEDFAADATHNSAAAGAAVNGVRVLGAPDEAGEFSIERGSRGVGETASAIFLTPYRRIADAGDPDIASSGARAGYDAFLDDIVEAARRFGYRPEESPGPGDPRIRGLRQ